MIMIIIIIIIIIQSQADKNKHFDLIIEFLCEVIFIKRIHQ